MAQMVRETFDDKAWNQACINIGMQSRGNKPLCSWETRLGVLAWLQGQERKAS